MVRDIFKFAFFINLTISLVHQWSLKFVVINVIISCYFGPYFAVCSNLCSVSKIALY